MKFRFRAVVAVEPAGALPVWKPGALPSRYSESLASWKGVPRFGWNFDPGAQVVV